MFKKNKFKIAHIFQKEKQKEGSCWASPIEALPRGRCHHRFR
jgi:hypothetical protein